MDGLLVVLILVGWIFSMAKKRHTPKKKTVLNVKRENAAALRAERAMQMHRELEQRRIQQVVAAPQEPVGEGESHREVQLAMEEAFRGSMQAESTEGDCICDPVLEHEREEEISFESVYAEEIGREPLIDFSAKGILQGVIMSEVLQRPAQRTRRMH